MKLLNFHGDETVTDKFVNSNADLTDESARSARDSKVSKHKPNTVTKIKKTKTTGPQLSPDDPNTVSKASRSDSTGHKVPKKQKQLMVEPKPGGLEVKKPKHLKKKRMKDTAAQS